MLGHEASNSSSRTVFSETCDLSIVLNPVVLEGLKLDGLVDVLGLLGLGVDLLLPLLTTSSQAEDKMQRTFLLDVVVAEGASVLELLSSKDEALLIGRNALFVLNFLFDIVNAVTGFHIQSYGFSRQCLYEDLHVVRLLLPEFLSMSSRITVLQVVLLPKR